MMAHICASTGWTWDYVAENIDLPRIQHLSEYWRRHPPVHILVASYIGYRAPDPATLAAEEAEAVQMFGGGETLSAQEFEALLKEKGIIQAT
ncbi:hypothetical protein [Neisseria shayeganii]|uniref:Uncharacterized protein n=1 Tax=Neisseria shayeganii TaxID=607712 RepID=A0A7D7ND26_9NEIS|nr:hypothetical protein [Neisseria shayeganii]QMT41238.1 hypothetical protein H3L94_04210 [Neisseria shayeganii]